MKSHWRDRSVYAASGACSAPNSGKKERSAWLPPSSDTNSCAGTTKSKVKIFRKGSRNFLAHGDSKVRKRREVRRPKLQRFSRPAMQRDLMSFLLAEEERRPERAERIRIDPGFHALRKRSGLASPFFPNLVI